MLRPKNRLQQLIAENTAGGDRRGLSIRQQGEGGVEILVYDVIDPWYGVSAKGFSDAIANIGTTPLTVRLNSPGGDVFEGRAIASMIRALPGPTCCVIDGLAASAASTIAVAANTLEMAVGSFLMVHQSWVLTMDNATGLRSMADLLDKIDQSIAADYAAKCGCTQAEAIAWMQAETWFTAEEALACKLCDAIDSAAEEAAEGASEMHNFNLSAFDRVPKALTTPKPQRNPAPDAEASRAQAARRLRLLDHAA